MSAPKFNDVTVDNETETKPQTPPQGAASASNETEKKETRGRKPKQGTKAWEKRYGKGGAPQGGAGDDDPEEKFKQNLGKIKDVEQPLNKEQAAELANALIGISGAELLILADSFLPSVYLWLYEKITKDLTDIDKDDIQLTDAQIKRAAPLFDKVAAILFKDIDPVTLAIITLSGMYVSNISTVKRKAPKKAKTQPKEKEK